MHARRSSLHCLQLLDCAADATLIQLKQKANVKTKRILTSLIALLCSSNAIAVQLIVEAVRILPPYDLHKRVDVAGSLGAEIHVIRVLVHVERQDRGPPASVWQWSEGH